MYHWYLLNIHSPVQGKPLTPQDFPRKSWTSVNRVHYVVNARFSEGSIFLLRWRKAHLLLGPNWPSRAISNRFKVKFYFGREIVIEGNKLIIQAPEFQETVHWSSYEIWSWGMASMLLIKIVVKGEYPLKVCNYLWMTIEIGFIVFPIFKQEHIRKEICSCNQLKLAKGYPPHQIKFNNFPKVKSFQRC